GPAPPRCGARPGPLPHFPQGEDCPTIGAGQRMGAVGWVSAAGTSAGHREGHTPTSAPGGHAMTSTPHTSPSRDEAREAVTKIGELAIQALHDTGLTVIPTGELADLRAQVARIELLADNLDD